MCIPAMDGRPMGKRMSGHRANKGKDIWHSRPAAESKETLVNEVLVVVQVFAL